MNPNSLRRPTLPRLACTFAIAFAASLTTIAIAQDATQAAAPAPTVSKIAAATVYTDRAIITRTAQTTLPAGESVITLEKLPAALFDDSVQVTGRGTATATILDVTTKITYTDNTADANQPRVKELQDEIKTLDQTLRMLRDRAVILQQQSNLVEKIENAIAAPPGKDSASQPKIDDMQKLMSFSQENLTKLATEQQSLSDESAKATGKRNALQYQLNEILRGANARQSYKTVTVRISAAQSGTLDLTLAYTVPGASWTPAYNARLRADTREVELAYFGIVRQSTGEDWNAIALTLSTARPGLGGGAPEGRPWYVDVVTPRAMVQNNTLSIGYSPSQTKEGSDRVSVDGVMAGAFMGNKAMLNSDETVSVGSAGASRMLITGRGLDTDASVPKSVTAAYAAATVDNATTSASFKIAAPATIPSDNSPQKVSVTTAKLAAKLQYQSMPALQETAYLSAYVTNDTEFPLIAGSVNVFLDDAFVSTSTLKTVMPSERFQLALGADEGVAIKRRVVNRFSENTGLTGKGRRVTYEYLVTITNNKKTTERVVFNEMIPISRNEKITVNLISPAERDISAPDTPAKEVTREEDNKLVWHIDMKPGEKREIPIKFSIEYPGDTQVSGL